MAGHPKEIALLEGAIKGMRGSAGDASVKLVTLNERQGLFEAMRVAGPDPSRNSILRVNRTLHPCC
jgi:hypothetical protein